MVQPLYRLSVHPSLPVDAAVQLYLLACQCIYPLNDNDLDDG